MRVLTVGNLYPPASSGGYERIWVSVVDALRRRGHEVRVLTTDAPAPPDDVLRELRWYWRDGEWVRRRGVERHDRRVVREQLAWADVVSWWGMGGLPLALLAEPERAGVPSVGVVADGWMIYGREVDPRGARARFPGRWLFISEAVRERAPVGGEIVPPGVDRERFAPAPPQPWGWRLAYVGRVAEGKGVDVAVAALAQLPEATLVVDGPGSEAVAGAETRVSPAEAVRDTYAEADAVLFPVTWPEPWGLVPLEAMSVGRPVVATGTGGSGEYLLDGENCLLVPPGDADALAAAVRRLAGDEDLRARLRSGGFATAERHRAEAFEDGVVAAIEAAAENRT